MNRLLLFLAAAAAIAFMIPGLYDQYQAPRLLALAAICVPLLLRRSDYSCSPEPAAWVCLALWALCVVFSRDLGISLVGSSIAPFDGLATVAVYVGLLVGISRLGSSAEEAAGSICLAAIPVAVYAIAQHFWQDPLLPQPLPMGRVIATQGSPVYLGAVLAIITACAAALVTGPRWILGVVTLALAVPALWLTQTRGAMLAALVSVLVLLPRRVRIASLLGLPALFLYPRLLEATSDAGRLEVWKVALAMFRDAPWFGMGPGTFEQAFRGYITPAYISTHHNAYLVSQSGHNLILQVLATSGIAGLIALLIAGQEAWTIAAQAFYFERPILIGASVAFLVVAQFNPVPHSAIALMVILFGSASARWTSAPRREYSYAGMALLSFYLAGRICVGDMHMARASRATLARDQVAVANELGLAAVANPWDVRNVARRIDAAMNLTRGMSAADRSVVAQACIEWSRQALKDHPQDSFTHEIAGRSSLVALSLGLPGDPNEAMAHFKRAQELAPTFPEIMKRRAGLARAMGDSKEAEQADMELARVIAWEKGA